MYKYNKIKKKKKLILFKNKYIYINNFFNFSSLIFIIY